MNRIVPASLLICLIVGCGSDDARLVQLSKEHEARQAEQNLRMADLQKSVADGLQAACRGRGGVPAEVAGDARQPTPLTRPPWASNVTSWKASTAKLPPSVSAIRSSPKHFFKSGCFWPACCPLFLAGYLVYTMRHTANQDDAVVTKFWLPIW